jgi:hypothetical protein
VQVAPQCEVPVELFVGGGGIRWYPYCAMQTLRVAVAGRTSARTLTGYLTCWRHPTSTESPPICVPRETRSIAIMRDSLVSFGCLDPRARAP